MSDPQGVTTHTSRRSAFDDDIEEHTAEPSSDAVEPASAAPPVDIDDDIEEPDFDDVDTPDFGDLPADDTDPDDDDDPFLASTFTPTTTPSPRGLPTLGGFDARTLGQIDEFAGEEVTPENVSPPGSLWGADDLVAVIDSPEIESVDDGEFDDEEPYVDDPDFDQEPPAPNVAPPYAEVPHAPAPDIDATSYQPLADDDDDDVGLADDTYAEDAAYLGDDTAPTEQGYQPEFYDGEDVDPLDDGSVEYHPGLDPDECLNNEVDNSASSSLRARSRLKARKTKPDSTTATSDDSPTKKPLPVKWFVLVLALLFIGFLVFRTLGHDTAQSGPKPSATPAQSAPTTSAAQSAANSPLCMTSPEVVGTAVACSAAGNQATGTNAILAYDNAFYGSRNADRAYSLTYKGSNGGSESEADKAQLQKDINGTPCGSTYVLTITPREIGKTYDVVVMVRSPQGDPMPAADGSCAGNIPEMSEQNPGTTRTLRQTITVSGQPGSYVIRGITTHQ